MSPWQLTIQSLRYYWRTQVTVLAGLTVATAILVGALIVGDSVRYSLQQAGLLRIGGAEVAVVGNDRFFRTELATELEEALETHVAPLLLWEGTVALPTGARRVNRVQLVGVDDRFWALARQSPPTPPAGWQEAAVGLNRHLARRMEVAPGDAVVIRFAKPSALPPDAPLATDADRIQAVRLPVSVQIDDDQLGRFSLRAEQTPPDSVFLPLPVLQRLTERSDRANLLLVAGGEPPPTPDQVRAALHDRWTLEDSELDVRFVGAVDQWELRSPRVFLDEPIVKAGLDAFPDALPVLTYFANQFIFQDRSTPYSMIAAVPFEGDAPWVPVWAGAQTDAMVINDWLARDLGADLGDRVSVQYYRMGPMRTLIETSAVFQVQAVTPLAGAAADPALMPAFPGMTGVDNCRDWDPGFPLDLDRIRDRDETYWDQYEGTPKAFVPLETGRALWANRFGHTTALRMSADGESRQTVVAALEERISPEQTGIRVEPIRQQALAAGQEAMDFGGLFVGFSWFLIAAALLLTGLLSAFGVEQRAKEIGTLLSLGYTPYQVQRIFLREGQLVAVLAAVLGAFAARGYTELLLHGLRSTWRGAIGDALLWFHATPTSMVVGVFTSISLGILVMAWSVRRLARRPVTQLLKAEIGAPSSRGGRPVWSWGIAAAFAAAAGWLLIRTRAAAGVGQAGGFFGAGALLLTAALVVGRNLLALKSVQGSAQPFTLASLATANLTRKRGRSLATAALLACGVFMVVGTGAHKVDAQGGVVQRLDGTGGFTWLVELSAPMARDLSQADVQDALGMNTNALAGVRFVPLRERPGDEASCLNLNRAQRPRLLAVSPDLMEGRFTFAAMEADDAGGREGWALLNQTFHDGSVPGIADINSIRWALGRGIGDSVEYRDAWGRPLRVRLVAGTANSILQGSILISEATYLGAFPSDSGASRWWIECDPENASAVAEELGFGLQDYGAEIVDARERLNEYNTVQNTYLLIFQMLGGMGLVLGSVGLGLVVLRNVLERRAELGTLRAVGFPDATVRRVLIREHLVLLLAGMLIGGAAASVAVAPSLMTPGRDLPLGYLAGMMAAVLINGILWTVGSAIVSLRGNLLDAIRSE